MRRWCLRLPRTALLVAAVLLAIAASLPLQVALALAGLDERGLSARQAEGTIWTGRLVDARVGDAALGTLDVRTSPWRLFLGRLHLTFEPAEAGGLAGRVETARRRFAFEGLTGVIPLGESGPLSGGVRLAGLSATFVSGQCVEAGGTVAAEELRLGGASGFALPPLSGQLRCEAGDAVVAMNGTLGTIGVDLAASLRADGTLFGELALSGVATSVAAPLRGSGFVRRPDGSFVRPFEF